MPGISIIADTWEAMRESSAFQQHIGVILQSPNPWELLGPRHGVEKADERFVTQRDDAACIREPLPSNQALYGGLRHSMAYFIVSESNFAGNTTISAAALKNTHMYII